MEKTLKELNEEVERLTKQIGKLKNNERPHNERGAGRKPKISATDILMAKDYRKAGRTYSEISSLLGLSLGSVYKILNPDKVMKTPDTKKEKSWDFAIGLSQVDGGQVSDDFIELVEREKRGEITNGDIRQALNKKYSAEKQDTPEQLDGQLNLFEDS